MMSALKQRTMLRAHGEIISDMVVQCCNWDENTCSQIVSISKMLFKADIEGLIYIGKGEADRGLENLDTMNKKPGAVFVNDVTKQNDTLVDQATVGEKSKDDFHNYLANIKAEFQLFQKKLGHKMQQKAQEKQIHLVQQSNRVAHKPSEEEGFTFVVSKKSKVAMNQHL
ncbi:unnamed protein product [Cuscuta epithymum]|uniref:Uncharacterized protein n=1 Tax=Cuscuta epithymum TaxID=186058 RepID=A0AAV0D9B4_9ASTE|nr:unnamed protein product [Cuscuta epithymum]